MKRNYRKLIALVMVLFMTVVNAIPAHATSTDGYTVVLDNDTYRIAEETIDTIKYVYTLDKDENVLITREYDISGVLKSTEIVDLDELLVATDININEDSLSVAATGYYQHTFSNYEYDQLSTTYYQLRNKSSYAYRYTTTDRDAIDRYISAVDVLNAAELVIISSGGVAVLAAVITYLTTGLTAGQAATAAGVLATDVIAYNLAVDNCIQVWNLYVDV